MKTSKTYRDGNDNEITARDSGRKIDGHDVIIAELVSEPGHGYLALDLDDCGHDWFGDETCPSSYNMPCLTWYGPNERYASADEALAAVA